MSERCWLERAKALAAERARKEVEARGRVMGFNYRLEHIKEVVRLSLRLGRELGADLEVLEAAAWLHDIAKEALEPGPERDAHGRKGAQEASDFLRGTDFPAGKLARVKEAIERHVGLFKDQAIEPPEAAILWDADKLTKLGATAIVLHLMDTLQDGSATLEAIAAGGERWLALAERVASSMNTEPAKELARERLEFLCAFYRELAEELAL